MQITEYVYLNPIDPFRITAVLWFFVPSTGQNHSTHVNVSVVTIRSTSILTMTSWHWHAQNYFVPAEGTKYHSTAVILKRVYCFQVNEIMKSWKGLLNQLMRVNRKILPLPTHSFCWCSLHDTYIRCTYDARWKQNLTLTVFGQQSRTIWKIVILRTSSTAANKLRYV